MVSKTGHSLIKSKMKKTGGPLAGEMSGHVLLADDYYGFDDALYAGGPAAGGIGATRKVRDRSAQGNPADAEHARTAVPARRGALVCREGRNHRPADHATRSRGGKRQHGRWRAGRHPRWLVAAERVEHAGRAGCTRGERYRGRPRPAAVEDRRATGCLRAGARGKRRD